MSFKKFVAPIAISAALLGGGAIATAGVATAATPTTAAAPAATGSHAKAGGWVKSHRRQLRRAGLVAAAKAIGMSPKDLRTELKTGKSIVQVAAEHNVSSNTVVSDLVTAADAKVDQAVTSGKLTADQATKIKAALPARITKAVNHVFK